MKIVKQKNKLVHKNEINKLWNKCLVIDDLTLHFKFACVKTNQIQRYIYNCNGWMES